MRVIGYLTSGYPSLEGCVKGADAYMRHAGNKRPADP